LFKGSLAKENRFSKSANRIPERRFAASGWFEKTSRPVSRVLSWTVIPLGLASPPGSSNLPGSSAGHANAPLFGLAPSGVCHATRRCPRARCALTAPFHPYHARLATPFGGLFSVALSVGSRRPGVTWHCALWSPDFPRNACTPRDHPADSLGIVPRRPEHRGPCSLLAEPVRSRARRAREGLGRALARAREGVEQESACASPNERASASDLTRPRSGRPHSSRLLTPFPPQRAASPRCSVRHPHPSSPTTKH